MKKLLLTFLSLLSLVVVSCSSDDEVEAPRFTGTELQFSPLEEKQETKLINYDLATIMNGDKPARDDNHLSPYSSLLKTSWFTATVDIPGKVVTVQVLPNDTGKERVFSLPVYVQKFNPNAKKSSDKFYAGQLCYITIRQESK